MYSLFRALLQQPGLSLALETAQVVFAERIYSQTLSVCTSSCPRKIPRTLEQCINIATLQWHAQGVAVALAQTSPCVSCKRPCSSSMHR